jgi:hypothetical protein
MGSYGAKSKKIYYKSKFCMVTPQKNSDLFMFHTQIQVCKKRDNSVNEKN